MTSFALGVIEDLRSRTLWPVALLLLVALVAVPIVLLEPAKDVPPPPPRAATSASPVGSGLPSPEEALQGAGKPLASLAVLNRSSDLASFDVKNPFKPLEALDDLVSDGTLALGAQAAAATGLGTSSDGGGGSTHESGSTGGGGQTGGGPSDSGGTPDGGGARAPSPEPSPEPTPTDPVEPERRLTYAADVTFDGLGPARRYRNLPRLSMLPSQESPLLVFLGIGASGNNAVFLVDSTLQAVNGEGACKPSPTECATLSIEPGEEQTFIDEQDRTYLLRIEQIRELPVSEVAEREGARGSARAGAAVGGGRPMRVFLPPLIDLIVIGGQR